MKDLEKVVDSLKLALGENQVKMLRNFAFEWACLEAEYMGLEKKGESFEALCILQYAHTRCAAWDEYIKFLQKYPNKKMKIRFPAPEILQHIIKEKYKK